VKGKKASELTVGDTFYRAVHAIPAPRLDTLYTVERLQFVPVRDFFGGILNTMQVTCRNAITGPAVLSIPSDEPLWVLDATEVPAVIAAPSQPAQRGRPSRFGGRWRRGGS
jgi:hypothetical protein